MRFLAALAAIAVTSVKAIPDVAEAPSQRPDHNIPQPEVDVVEVNKEYIVRLDCVGCPYAAPEAFNKASWQQPPHALKLKFNIDTKYHEKPTLLLNGRGVLPLEPMTPFISALQVPANITKGQMRDLGYGSKSYGVQIPLQYEHTVLRTQEQGEIWVQFDITDLPLDVMNDPRYVSFDGKPFKMDSEEQKLVQLRLHQNKETGELLIEEVSVVKRADRVQPYRMKCGRLAMIQTTYDPREWDIYGKYGTWERMQNLVVDKVTDFWSDYMKDFIMFPLGMMSVYCLVLARRWFERRRARKATVGDDAEVALLSSGYDDAPPAYADIPVIKIEEYD